MVRVRRHLRTFGSRVAPGFLAAYHQEDGQVVRALWYIVVAVGDGRVGITGWAGWSCRCRDAGKAISEGKQSDSIG